MNKVLVIKTLFKTFKFQNSKFSYDSHECGFLKVHDSSGKVIFLIPYNKIRSVEIKEVK